MPKHGRLAKRSSKRNLANQLAQLENTHLVHHLIEEEPAYIFKHALIQDAVYESVLVKKRRELHKSVAQACEELYSERRAMRYAQTMNGIFAQGIA